MIPMTLSITFDDGLLAQATVAAPMMEKFGWHGVFAVPTQILTDRRLSHEQAEDLCLGGCCADRLMTWDDVRRLVAHGHTVCPHTCSHADLAALVSAGRYEEAEREIAESKRQLSGQTGRVPRLFCLPHSSRSKAVDALVRKHGMEPINGVGKWRPNFGESAPNGESHADIVSFVRRYFYLGIRHADIVIHGVVRSDGGWRPFDGEAQFEHFLKCIRAEEAYGRVRVVDYTDAHRLDLSCPHVAAIRDVIAGRARSFFFSIWRHALRIHVPEAVR